MRLLTIPFIALLLVGCAETYRYPCQDPENKDKPECNRPLCEADGFCYDKLNGLPEQEAAPVIVEEVVTPVVTECNSETKGE